MKKIKYKSKLMLHEYGWGIFVLGLILFAAFNNCSSSGQSAGSSKTLSNSLLVECDHDAYNCPGYTGPNQHMRLPTCQDVDLVWAICGSDPHGLDADNDGLPCESDCH